MPQSKVGGPRPGRVPQPVFGLPVGFSEPVVVQTAVGGSTSGNDVPNLTIGRVPQPGSLLILGWTSDRQTGGNAGTTSELYSVTQTGVTWQPFITKRNSGGNGMRAAFWIGRVNRNAVPSKTISLVAGGQWSQYTFIEIANLEGVVVKAYATSTSAAGITIAQDDPSSTGPAFDASFLVAMGAIDSGGAGPNSVSAPWASVVSTGIGSCIAWRNAIPGVAASCVYGSRNAAWVALMLALR